MLEIRNLKLCFLIPSLVKTLDKSKDTFEIVNSWKLPGNIKKAEALIVIDNNNFLVAEDHKNSKTNNLHFLISEEKTNINITQK